MAENEDRLGEEEVVLLMMVMMMSGTVVRVNVNVNRMCLRGAGVVSAGSRL